MTVAQAAEAEPAAHSAFIEADGLALHCVTWRSPQRRARRRLLLLHGLGGTTIHWELVAPRLAERLGADVTAVDLPGFGLTRATEAQATLCRTRAAVTELLEHRGPFELVGNSMGGALALALAARRPELVRHLVLVTPALPQPPWPHPPLPILPHNWPAAVPGLGPAAVATYAASTPDDRVVDERLTRSFHDNRRIDAGVRARMIELVRVRRDFPEAPYTYAAATRSLFWYLAHPAGIMRDVRRVTVPVEILHGAEDRLIPLALAEAAVAIRPDWRLRVFEDCGHMPQLEMPERFVAALEETPPASRAS